MHTLSNRYEIGLAPRALLEIPDVAGVEVTCDEGSVWITLDNDTRDIVLEAGQVFSSPEHRRGLVYAFEASTLGLRPELCEAVAEFPPSISFAPRAGLAA